MSDKICVERKLEKYKNRSNMKGIILVTFTKVWKAKGPPSVFNLSFTIRNFSDLFWDVVQIMERKYYQSL